MLRDKNLIPLSRQHQRALALCVRIDRAQPIPHSDLSAWLAEIEQHFTQEMGIHFSAEETVLFPAARRFPELIPLVEELIADHGLLREYFSRAKSRSMSAEELMDFGQLLSRHIRKEERQLFEWVQQLMSGEDLAILGVKLETALQHSAQSCILPNNATKLKP